MPEAVSHIKDPTKVAAGALGAEKRWSNPANRRVVRLDDLSAEQKRLVLALIAAAREGEKAAVA